MPLLTSQDRDRAVLQARRWAKAHPELSTRLNRAIALVDAVEHGTVVGKFRVRGTAAVYEVTIDVTNKTSACTCPDSGKHIASHCKHQLAVGLWLSLLGG